MPYLVDTNIVSEPLKAEPNAQVMRWLQEHEQELFVSSITIEEMRFGALFLPDGKRKRALNAAIDELIDAYGAFVWAFDAPAAESCAQLHVLSIRSGRTPSIEDLMIGAIAKTHGATVVTRNVKDFDYLGIPIVDPFSEGRNG